MAMIGQNWIDATRRNLLGGFNETRNRLSIGYASGGTTLTFSDPMGQIAEGVTLSIGLNVFYVISVKDMVATVVGGQNGSTDIACAAGSIVRINPKFTDWDIWQALAYDLSDLSGPSNGLYSMTYADVTYSAVLTGYDLGAVAAQKLISIYEVKYLRPGPHKDNPKIPSWAYRLNRQSAVGDIPSGLSLQILNSAGMTQGYNVRVVYKAAFSMPATPTSDASTTGLAPTAFDLPPLGAAIYLMAGQEIKRNFISSQGDARRATEVPAGAVAASANGLKQLRHSRINAEASRLNQMYPIVKD